VDKTSSITKNWSPFGSLMGFFMKYVLVEIGRIILL
jgi:hypothetical protein